MNGRHVPQVLIVLALVVVTGVTRLAGAGFAQATTGETTQRPPVGPLTVQADCPAAGWCIHDTGWGRYDPESACEARTVASWSRENNRLNVEVHTRSPYLFAGCWVNAGLKYGVQGVTLEGPSFYGMACSRTDPSPGCGQPRAYPDQESGLPALFVPLVNSMWVVHTRGTRPGG
jgi:hypothetical protein